MLPRPVLPSRPGSRDPGHTHSATRSATRSVHVLSVRMLSVRARSTHARCANAHAASDRTIGHYRSSATAARMMASRNVDPTAAATAAAAGTDTYATDVTAGNSLVKPATTTVSVGTAKRRKHDLRREATVSA